MREAYGSAWTLGLVLVFTIIFASYLAISISYQMSFKMKNEVIGFIEREEGLTITSKTDGMGAMPLINNYLRNSGYKQKGVCPEGWIGIINLSSTISTSDYEVSEGKARYYYCVQKVKDVDNVHPLRAHYKVRLFFKFDLPVLGDIFTFDVDGETTDIAIPGDEF